jgi:hypothetical protein
MVLDVISPREDNKGNTRWVKVGVAFENNNATRILLDAYPVPNQKGEVVLLVKERKTNVSEKNEPQSVQA